MKYRTGFGYDVHRMEPGDYIILGGVKIQHYKKITAYSDGDILVHAICDALLGAAALGDIGHHFPDTDERFKGISGRFLLTEVAGKIKSEGYAISNIDSTVVLQTPKIAAYISQIRENIANWLAIDISQVSVKATTTEKLGFAGNEEGIAVYSVVLLENLSN